MSSGHSDIGHFNTVTASENGEAHPQKLEKSISSNALEHHWQAQWHQSDIPKCQKQLMC